MCVCVCASACFCVSVAPYSWGMSTFYRACEKHDVVELCQPGGQNSMMFACLYSNRALCGEIRKEMFYEGEMEKGGKRGRRIL